MAMVGGVQRVGVMGAVGAQSGLAEPDEQFVGTVDADVAALDLVLGFQEPQAGRVLAGGAALDEWD